MNEIRGRVESYGKEKWFWRIYAIICFVMILDSHEGASGTYVLMFLGFLVVSQKYFSSLQDVKVYDSLKEEIDSLKAELAELKEDKA